MKISIASWAATALPLMIMLSALAAEPPSLRFFKDLAETRSYTLGRPVKPALTPDGSAVIFLRGGARDPVMRLFELDAKTGKVEEILTPDQILRGSQEKLSVEERARRERMRQSLRGFTSFELSEDGSQILVALEGKLYVVRRSDKGVAELPLQGWIDPHFSRDGKYVAAVKDGDLHIIDVAAKKETQLTTGASEVISHGLAEFVAQEEMDRFSGFWWSPDSNSIVYQETDLSPVEKHYIANPLHPSDPPERYFYPRAGTANAKVRLGIIARIGGVTKWIRWDSEKFPYLTRVFWQEKGPLAILVQTRNQREEKLLSVNPSTGDTHELLTETDSAWLDLPPDPQWLKDGSGRFLWASERKGDWQLELHDASGKFIRDLSPVGLNYQDLLDVDEKSGEVMITASPDPREEHIFRLTLNGDKPRQITKESGFHTAYYSRQHNAYVYESSLTNGSWGMELRSEGKKIAELPSVAEKIPSVPDVEFLRIGPKQFDAAILRPHDFDPHKKYPVVLSVYAGPTSKQVKKLRASYLEDQWMADQGFIVATLDGRGTPGHGRDWLRAVKGNLIDIALQDQVEGLKALGEKYAEMDSARVGVSGWSFGGYFSAMATIRRPDVFQCGVAGAPVVDWEDYDTHYTERYMDLPSANPDGYKKSNVLTYAAQLQRPLLIIHGLTDDNVYFEHSLKLMDALFQAQKSYEFLPLLSTHMVPDPSMKLSGESRIINFLRQHLGGPK